MEKFENYKEELKLNNSEFSDEFLEEYFELRKDLWAWILDNFDEFN